MTRDPTCPRVAPCSPPSSTLRAGSADGPWPCLTATVRAAVETSGRDKETALVSRTKKPVAMGKTNDRGSVPHVVKGSIPDVAGQLPLPSYAPELNPVENIWEFLRGNWLSHSVWPSYDAIVDACCEAWNKRMRMPEQIASITRRSWAARTVSG